LQKIAQEKNRSMNRQAVHFLQRAIREYERG